MTVNRVIKSEIDDLVLNVDDNGIYISNAGCSEHWNSKYDFLQAYPEFDLEVQ